MMMSILLTYMIPPFDHVKISLGQPEAELEIILIASREQSV